MTTASGSAGALRRIATISLHTSPLLQPGTGDAGGMNVYIDQTTRRLAARGIAVEVFTRATSADQEPVTEVAPGVSVRHIVAGPFGGLDKDQLPAELCSFTAGVLRAEARRDPGHYDLLHAHYWLSGQVGYLAKDRWGVPLVFTAHTLAKVKNAALAEGDRPEPSGRLLGEEQVVAEADRLVANTTAEAGELISLYGADRSRVDVVPPGVDTDVFRPAPDRRAARVAARRELGLPAADRIVVFAGRVQPLKAPDVLVRALALLRARHPHESWRLVVVGGRSGGSTESNWLADLADTFGVRGAVDFRPPVPAARLAQVFAAADVVAVPSHNESFGLVALEAQATGTPVVAAAVGGLTTAVAGEVSGVLVDGHDPQDWASALARVVLEPGLAQRMGAAAARHAARFSWEVTVDGLIDSYTRAVAAVRSDSARREQAGYFLGAVGAPPLSGVAGRVLQGRR